MSLLVGESVPLFGPCSEAVGFGHSSPVMPERAAPAVPPAAVAPASKAVRSASRARTSAGSSTAGSTSRADGPAGTSLGSFSTNCSTSSLHRTPLSGSGPGHKPGACDDDDSPTGWDSFPIDRPLLPHPSNFRLEGVFRNCTLTMCPRQAYSRSGFGFPLKPRPETSCTPGTNEASGSRR